MACMCVIIIIKVSNLEARRGATHSPEAEGLMWWFVMRSLVSGAAGLMVTRSLAAEGKGGE